MVPYMGVLLSRKVEDFWHKSSVLVLVSPTNHYNPHYDHYCMVIEAVAKPRN